MHFVVHPSLPYCLLLVGLFLTTTAFAQEATSCDAAGTYIGLYEYEHPAFAEAQENYIYAWGTRDVCDYENALNAYHLASDSLALRGCWEAYLWGLCNMLSIYSTASVLQGQWEEALPILQEALDLETDKLPPDHPIRTTVYFYEGRFAFRAFDAETAIRAFQQTIALRSKLSPGANRHLAHPYYELSKTFLHLTHDPARSQTYLDTFFTIVSDPTYDREGDQYFGYYQVQSFLDLSTKLFEFGNYDRSISYALRLLDSIHLHPYNQQFYRFGATQLLGNNMRSKQLYPEAERWFEESLNILHTAFDTTGPYYGLYESIAQVEYGKLELERNDFEAARSRFNQALHQLSRKPSKDQAPYLAEVFRGLAMCEIDQKDWQAGINLLDSSLIYWQQSPLPEADIAACLLQQGEIYHTIDDLQNASLKLEAAWALLQQLSPASLQTEEDINKLLPTAGLAIDLLSALAKNSQPGPGQDYDAASNRKAYNWIADAITLIEASLYSYDRENRQIAFKQETYDIYELALSILAERYEHEADPSILEEAFALMEGSKAKFMMDRLNAIDQEQELSDLSLQQERILRQTLAYLNGELRLIEQTQGTTNLAYKQTHRRLLQVEEARKQLFTDIQLQLPSSQLKTPSSKKLSLSGSASFLRRHKYEDLISYFWGKQQVYAFRLSANGQHQLIAIDDPQGLKQKAYQMHRHLGATLPGNLDSLKKEALDYADNAYSLYQAILEPIVASPLKPEDHSAGHRLVISPDGPLNLIPFEALLVEEMTAGAALYDEFPYLLERAKISYSPSFQVLAWERPAPADLLSEHLLAFGFGTSAEQNTAAPRRDNTVVGLPGTIAELDSISQHFSIDRFEGNWARKDSFLHLASNYDAIHLALHGKADSLYDSRIIFPAGHDHEEQYLYPWELLSLPIRASLVTISTCESGLGQYVSGEGMRSLGNGFLQAGCQAVVMSLWQVEDRRTAKLMNLFYRNMAREDQQLDEALRAAKLEAIRQGGPYFSFPGYWSSFVLNGKHSLPAIKASASRSHKPWPLFLGIGLLSLAVLLLGVYFAPSQKDKQ